MRNLIILAGGQGTRLGPLTATHSKALVSVQQRPMLVHHITAFPEAENIVIVTNEATQRQVTELVQQAFGHYATGVNVHIVSQYKPKGPVDAINIGLHYCMEGSVTVVFADTLLEDWESPLDGDAVAVTPNPRGRSFCWWSYHAEAWKDGICDDSAAPVFIGLLHALDAQVLLDKTHEVLKNSSTEGEIPMSELLNCWQPKQHAMFGWHDTGDVKALQKTRRELFISREKHQLRVDDRGVLTKVGASVAQKNFFNMLPYPAMTLFPMIYSTVDELQMEFIDLPSLAELWLYQPGSTDMWKDMLKQLLHTITENLWDHRTANMLGSDNRAYKMFWEKPIARLQEAGEGTKRLMDPLIGRLLRICQRSYTRDVTLHGDLNFNNVLVSLPNGYFKLLDPRGEWGDHTGRGDYLYDLAKLRYSWRGFSAITHGLDPGHRAETATALDQVLIEFTGYDCLQDLAAIEATLFLSALPLHPLEQRPGLMRCAQAAIAEATA